MRDIDVRAALSHKLAATLADHAHLVAHEVDIRWHTPARMDVLAVSDRIAGYEIKSDVDSLARLPRQAEAYGDVVERAYLVAGSRHLEHASVLVPQWWGVWSATRSADGQVKLREVRRSRLNPAISPLAVSTLMSRRELVEALTALGERNLTSRGVEDLRAMLVSRCGSRRTVTLARQAMLQRTRA